ncbi:MAG: alanine dehydrogenase, partial [Candidatus Eisenbacteria bacterium]|nr:alanine dehydrogenase [Candidatus Eisenbacteria bacterium]
GILMGNVPGVPPPTVLILGAGTVGSMAACQALASGAHVIVFDASLPKLRHLNNRLSGRAVTMVPTAARLAQYSAIADVLIGAVLIPGGRAPYLITEEMVRAMKPGSVILDIAIDQGGCVETSRPTTLDQPTFKMHDVIHFCVPNMTANVARTASRALANEVLPFIQNLANLGVDGALWEDVGLGRGVYLYRGEMVNEGIGKAMNIPVKNLRDLLPGDGVS